MSGTILKKLITSSKLAKPIGPYNQAVLWGNTLYLAGMLGVNKEMKLVEGGIVPQSRQALQNIGYVLEEAGTSFNNVIKSTIFLNDINDYSSVNDVYKEFFKCDFPARSTFQVAKLPLNALVEIEIIAAVVNG